MSESENQRPVAIVTGALRGIGQACAIGLADAGFNLVLNDRSGVENAVLAQKVGLQLAEQGAEYAFVPGDVSQFEVH